MEITQAVIKDKKVINIIVADDNFIPDVDYDYLINTTLVHIKPGIGWEHKEKAIFDASIFTKENR